MFSGWRFNGAQLLKTSMELVNPASFSEKDDPIFSSCSSASMVDSFGPSFNGGLFDLHSKVSSSSLPILAHPSLAPLPADTAFIERAARLSCFNGGNLMEVATPFGIPQAMALYSRSLGTNQEMNSIDGMRLATVRQPQKQEISDLGETSMDVCLDHGTENPENDGKRENLVRSHKEQKPTIGRSGGESEDEEPSTAEGGEEEPSGNGIRPRKRKRVKQNTELDQAKENSTGKHRKQGFQASNRPKEEYIHVRARRGQATNSHSLAERVRREKISERMKFLQDLVPGCSKVIGKAVMLDEIISYVQSLQQQVEFLSMKLAMILQTTLSSHSTMPMLGGFMEPAQLPTVWEDELHHVFQMSYASSNNIYNL